MCKEEMEIADFHKMERIRSRVDSIVEDEDTAERLKPIIDYSASGLVFMMII